jgi:hypothetical protein
MAREQQVRLTPNGNGAQPFLNDKLLGDSLCPLEAGGKARAINTGVGVLLAPLDDDREFEIHPQEVDNEQQ